MTEGLDQLELLRSRSKLASRQPSAGTASVWRIARATIHRSIR